MRFAIFLFLMLFMSIQTWGQEPLFLVVDFSAGVTIDGRAPKIDEIVDGTSKEIFIPKNGYTLIIAREGYVYSITKSISIDKVEKKVKRAFRPRATGAVLRSFYEIELIGVPLNQFAEVLGDSILIAFKFNYIKPNPPFVIEYKSMFDEVLNSDSISTNWKTPKVNLYNQDAVLFDVRNSKYHSKVHLIKRMNDEHKRKLTVELSKVEELRRSEIIKLVIFESYGFLYDQTFLLYRLTVSDYKPENVFLQAYVERLRKKYHFELFDFHK